MISLRTIQAAASEVVEGLPRGAFYECSLGLSAVRCVVGRGEAIIGIGPHKIDLKQWRIREVLL
jgi:hypothetical protein